MTLRVILTRGIPGSGKSTWAKQLQDEKPHVYKRLNKDEMRVMLDNSIHSKNNEQFVLRMEEFMMIEALKAGKHVILDNTQIGDFHVERVKNVLKNNGLQGRVLVEIKEFDTPLEECIKRDLKRANSVGEHVIKKMWKQWHGPLDKKQNLKPEDLNLLHAILCDLDGTIALMNDRGPYEWHKVGSDDPNYHVLNIVNEFHGRFPIIYMSGRDEICRKETEEWLKRYTRYNENIDMLYMRPQGDNRSDVIVKKELYEKYVDGKYNIWFCLDDRTKIVELWRELGLTCLQVAEGDF